MVMERAERVLASLADEAPCFLKCMLPSNVTYSFWLVSQNFIHDLCGGTILTWIYLFLIISILLLFCYLPLLLWQIIPKRFCSLHLPSEDSTVILVDEWGKEYKTNYLIDRHGLSAGWRGFSISHRLLKGDILIFRLIAPCKLKVNYLKPLEVEGHVMHHRIFFYKEKWNTRSKRKETPLSCYRLETIYTNIFFGYRLV